MNKNPKNLTTNENAVPFFSKITATFTHELNNIIAIIEQSAGLMEDLLSGPDKESKISSERWSRIVEKIIKHSSRGIILIKNLNTFSHGVDQNITTVNINKVILNLKELTTRIFNNKGIKLELELIEQGPELHNNPFVIQQIVFMIIEKVLPEMQSGHNLKLRTAFENESAIIILESCLKEESCSLDFDPISSLAESINAVLDFEINECDLLIRISIGEIKSEYGD